MKYTRIQLENAIYLHRLWKQSKGEQGQELNLEHANLEGMNLSHLNFDGVNLYGADLSRSQIDFTIFSRAKLQHAKFVNVRGNSPKFTEAQLFNTEFINAELPQAVFIRATGIACSFVGTALHLADFTHCRFTNSDFTSTDLTEVMLPGQFLGCKNLVALHFDRRCYVLAAWRRKDGFIMFNAGCRCYTLDEAKAHWGSKYYDDPKLGKQYVAACEFLHTLFDEE